MQYFNPSERPLSLGELQEQVHAWQLHNFPEQRSHEPALGVPEELGELWEAVLGLINFGALSAVVGRVCHAELKLGQSIRGTREELAARLEDAIGDLVIFLVNLCNTRGLDLQRIVDRTWAEVSKRDWKKDPLGGGIDG
jgi:NTP pyrophosphatase (non-canonical NTP hydrolase)